MNSGIVTEVIHLSDKTWVRVQFNEAPAGLPVAQWETLYVERCYDINVGDLLEWDGFWAVWRVATGGLIPRKLRLKGKLGAPRPEVAAKPATRHERRVAQFA